MARNKKLEYSDAGGHIFACGHVKYCYDHVQMVIEKQVCNVCRVVKKYGNQPDKLMPQSLVKKIVDGLFDSNILDESEIW